jgi:hypothetical protein
VENGMRLFRERRRRIGSDASVPFLDTLIGCEAVPVGADELPGPRRGDGSGDGSPPGAHIVRGGSTMATKPKKSEAAAKKSKKSSATAKSKKVSTAAAKAKASDLSGLKIVVEGDSWERLPNFGPKSLPIVGGSGYDLSRALTDIGLEVENLAYWGDELADIVRIKDYMAALRQTGAKAFLLGGGGNDLLSGGRMSNWVHLYTPGLAIADYLKQDFYDALSRVMANYWIALNDVVDAPDLEDVHVFVHGYDYARPMKLGWIGEPLARMGIDEYHEDIQTGIVAIMIDEFNRRLAKLASHYDRVHYVDFRNRVGDRWHDELHPRKEAFVDLGADLAAAIAAAI